MKDRLQLPFRVPVDYRHIWMLFGRGRAVAMIGIEGESEIVLKSAKEAEGMMSEVLDREEEVVAQIRHDCERKDFP